MSLQREPRPPRDSFQESLEATSWGKGAISAFLVLLLGVTVVWNLPAGSELKRRLLPWVQPLALLGGLDQNWSVFSPEPQMTSSEIIARIDYVDGSSRTWRVPPMRNRLWSAYRVVRWRKLTENMRRGNGWVLWEPMARWIAKQESKHGLVEKVTLIRMSSVLNPPGHGKGSPNWVRDDFYIFRVVSRSS